MLKIQDINPNQNAPSVETVEPVKQVERRTRARGLKAINNVCLIALAFLAIITGAIGKQCNYTSFSENPGLYFEENGQMTLTNDK